MAIAYRASAQVFGTTTSTNITIPASVQVGDLLVMQAVGGWAPTIPAGWTQDYLDATSSNVRAFVAYRVAQAGDAGTAVAVTWTNAYNHVVNMIAVGGSSTFRTPRIHTRASTGGTATLGPVSLASGDCVIYIGGNRQDGGPPTLTRGTTVQSASDGSTIAAGIVAYEILGADGLIQNTYTAPSNGSGYLYSLLAVSDGGTPANHAIASANYTEALIAGSGNAQVESNYAEALIDAPSLARVESNYLEVLHSSASAQVETVYAEALINATPDARIATVYTEALMNAVPDAQVATVYTEALISAPRLQAETVYAEVIDAGTPEVQAESVYAEVVVGGTPLLQAEALYLEVIVGTMKGFRGWGMPVGT